MKAFDGRSLLVIGDADPSYDATLLEEFRACGHGTVIVAGADHSIDIPGDVPASVRAVERVVQALRYFIAT